ncbi:copper chaperone PCu(A)C [Streptomyces maoxianensis]|uniref:Copper chaperone PCu(A)C n=1 Tax=Streptomyces maoxianensis TaxID=1459942 RepID=A0ABV9GGI1_9ACTN
MNRRATSASALAPVLASVIALTAGAALAGCSTSSGNGPELKVSGAFMPQPVGDDMAAGFLTVQNSGGDADKLTSVTSDISDDITIHETNSQKMQEVNAFDVPADGELDLERGGSHIMFMKLKQKPKQGEKVAVELRFEKSGPIKVELPVKEPTYNPMKHEH